MLHAETRLKHSPQTIASLDPPTINAADPLIVFAYECLRREFAALAEHRPRENEIPSPEAIHRTRIAARRLRVALRMFKRVLPPGTAPSLATELRWFARALGEIRDLDVYTDNLHRYSAGADGDRAALAEYERHVNAVRDAARATLPALFSDPRYLALLEAFAKFVANGPPHGALRRWRSLTVSEGARGQLRKSLRRIVKRGDRIAAGSAARELHRLRIMAKRLRYELEFFAEVYPSLHAAAKVAKRLQDVLGEHQDSCTASARVRRYVHERGGAAGPLVALRQSHDREAAAAQRRFELEWRSFKKNLSLDDLIERVAA